MPIRHVEDYYDQVIKKFPELKRDELDKMMKHTLRSMYMLIAYGADVLIKHKTFTMYFGNMFKNKKKWRTYYLLKWSIKYRLLWTRRKRKWDGYYYFLLTEEQRDKWFGKKHGRLKKKVVFDEPIVGYKMPEECYLHSYGEYYYKVAWPKEEKFRIHLEGHPIRDVVYVGKLDKSTHNITFNT